MNDTYYHLLDTLVNDALIKKLLMKHILFSLNFKYTFNDIKSLRMSRNLKTKILIKFKDGVIIKLTKGGNKHEANYCRKGTSCK